ncbi:MAG: hypothetical protein QG556_728 [Pseudomonadota bacterium]|nr:hypothetical protein [Pseudomonadota bacterium]
MKNLEHHDYTPFEYACQIGNIPGLKLIFTHQEPQENNPIYLNGLLQSIAGHQLDVAEFLLNHPAYQRIIEKNQKKIIQQLQEHGHYHLLEILDDIMAQDILSFQIPLPMEELHHNLSLDMPEQIVLQTLSTYYQSSISQKNVTQHLEEIQEKLACLYQQQPIAFNLNNDTCLFLPLSWEAFQLLSSSFEDDTQKQMLQAYLTHPIHCAWRFFLNIDPWSSQIIDFNAHHTDIRWMLILMWTAAHDKHLINHLEVDSLEERMSLFINKLANLRHQAGDGHMLQKFLIHSIVGHPLTKILDASQLWHKHDEFIKHY